MTGVHAHNVYFNYLVSGGLLIFSIFAWFWPPKTAKTSSKSSSIRGQFGGGKANAGYSSNQPSAKILFQGILINNSTLFLPCFFFSSSSLHHKFASISMLNYSIISV